jgi:hypothetical protein
VPALPAVPKTVALAFTTLSGTSPNPAVNKLHFAYTGTPPTPAQLASFATTVLTAFGSAVGPFMSSDNTISALEAVDLSSPVSATATVTAAIAGALTPDKLPDDTCVVLSATVGRRYRGGHPRTYLPVGVVAEITNGNLWNATWLGTLLTAWDGFVTAVEGAGWTGAGTIAPVNVSYYFGYHLVTYPSGRSRDIPTLRVGGPVIDPILGYIPRQKLGVQRRRRAG